MDSPTDDELAAIAAAYALLLRRSAEPEPTTPPSRWRRAARTAILDEDAWPRRSKRS